MSFASFQEVTAPTVVSHCEEVYFGNVRYLCTIAGNHLTLHKLRNATIMLVWSTPLQGKVKALCILKGQGQVRDDRIGLLFDSPYMAFFGWESTDNALKCITSYILDKVPLDESFVTRGTPFYKMYIDPSSRCLGCQIETTSLFIFQCTNDISMESKRQQVMQRHSPYCIPSGIQKERTTTTMGTDYVDDNGPEVSSEGNVVIPEPGVICVRRDLKLHQLDDWVFLHGYENTCPTFAASGKTESAWSGKIHKIT